MNPLPDMNWLLDNLVSYPHAVNAVVLSADGLSRHRSKGVDDALADRVAALSSGLASLAKSGARFVTSSPTPYELTMIRYGDGYLFIIAAGQGSFLVASATIEVDVSVFTDRMTHVVGQMHTELGVSARQAGQG
ncbi:roadblock/LC7 domain-containing protein [Streptomyces sp. NBC_01237]|uniref:roadblock/LC7 domain-containing protein n=1 Tax=Streptomyces sp. NBC_01237 TaxID=2903790 RepID=UPI002DD7C2C4|nr:roadblock/LC7 domain-containing protein [Streptomyces sp. NBC_01237]WRZ77189.1 roadblock/LC7 domain-containing protein [Streptomyces sp. NBC_01237]